MNQHLRTYRKKGIDSLSLDRTQNNQLLLGDQEFVAGEGACLYNSLGEEFIDLNCNATLPLGHDADLLREVFAGNLPLNVGLYAHPWRTRLLELLEEMFPDYTGFQFYSSGTAANEGMLRYAMQITGRSSFYGLSGAYYGRSKATASMSGMEPCNGRRIEGYDMLPFPGHDMASDGYGVGEDGEPHPLAEEFSEMIGAGTVDDLAGLVIEPYHSKRMIPFPSGWLRSVQQEVLRPRGILLLADEYLVSGRAGVWQVTSGEGVQPDLFTFGKFYTNGIPFGGLAVLRDHADKVSGIWGGDTYGGHPAACELVLRTVTTINRQNLLEYQERISRLFLQRFAELEQTCGVSRVCARGGLLGIEFTSPQRAEIVGRHCLEGRLLVAVVRRLVRMTPPLIIDELLLQEAFDRLFTAIQSVSREQDEVKSGDPFQ